jgi:RNA polymerase sigma-70 factor (ECF subfamily)
MAAQKKAAYLAESEDFGSNTKIVKFSVLGGDRQQEAAQEQELPSFETLMLPHLDAAYNLARWLLRNEDDARDVVQEAYLRAFKSFGGFHGSNGRPWLLTIVRNSAYSLMKKNQAAAHLTTTFDENEYLPERELAVSPATLLEHDEQGSLVRQAIDRLPDEFREILVLRHLEGLSYKEIADIAQVAPGTVMSRLARARGKLREFLKTGSGKEIMT